MVSRKSLGFAHQWLLLLVVVVAAIVAVGYRVYSNNHNKTTTANTTATAPKTNAAPTNFTSKADLQQASQSLDSDQGPSQLDPTQLDNSLNQLL